MLFREKIMKAMGLNCIKFDPKLRRGELCIREMRVTVSTVIDLMTSEVSFDAISEAHPYLETASL